MQDTQLVFDIYDCAVNPARWESVVDKVVTGVGAKGGIIMSIPPAGALSWSLNHFSELWRHLPAEKIAYMQQWFYQYEEEAWQALRRFRPLEYRPDNEAYSERGGLEDREDYLYLKEHVGVLRKVGLRLNDDLASFDALAFQFDKKYSSIPAQCGTAIKSISPHFAKALELNRIYSELRSRHKAVLSALDHVDIGLCILNRRAEVVITNEECDRIMSETGLIAVEKGRLSCKNSDKQDLLQQHIRHVCNDYEVASSPTIKVIELKSACKDHPVIVNIAHLKDSSGELGHQVSGALITVIDTAKASEYDASLFASLYELTQAEQDVATELLRGFNNVDIAEIRNVSVETVRTQVKSIYSKSQTSNRVELVQLILKITPPVSG